jgi:hypothetical protein
MPFFYSFLTLPWAFTNNSAVSFGDDYEVR